MTARRHCVDCGGPSSRERCWSCHLDHSRALIVESGATRFWAQVDRTGDCWVWTGPRGANGYGRGVSLSPTDRRRPLAHRQAYELTFGAIPDGMFVCHRCDNPPCVRPDHLFLGTNRDNLRDASAKGRVARGERVHGARLTPTDVVAIREALAAGASVSSLSRSFGVSRPSIDRIRSRHTWGWVA